MLGPGYRVKDGFLGELTENGGIGYVIVNGQKIKLMRPEQ